MIDLFQTITPVMIVNAEDGNSVSSATDITTEKYVNCENNKYVTFLINVQTCGTGEQFAVYKATNASGGGTTIVATPFIGNVYYTNVASVSAATVVQTTASTSNTISVAATSYAMYYATVDTTTVTSATYPYISMLPNGNGMANMDVEIMAFMHGQRYQNETGFDVLA